MSTLLTSFLPVPYWTVPNLLTISCRVLTLLLLLPSFSASLFNVRPVIPVALKTCILSIKLLKSSKVRWLTMAKSSRPRAGKSSRKTPRRYYVGGAQF